VQVITFILEVNAYQQRNMVQNFTHFLGFKVEEICFRESISISISKDIFQGTNTYVKISQLQILLECSPRSEIPAEVLSFSAILKKNFSFIKT